MKINTNILNLAQKLTPAQQDKALTEQSQKWVSQTFYGTLLKQLHNSPFKSEVFSGGRGAQAFGPLVDQNLVDRLGRATGNKLVKSLVKSMKSKAARKAEAAAKQSEGGKNVSTIA